MKQEFQVELDAIKGMVKAVGADAVELAEEIQQNLVEVMEQFALGKLTQPEAEEIIKNYAQALKSRAAGETLQVSKAVMDTVLNIVTKALASIPMML